MLYVYVYVKVGYIVNFKCMVKVCLEFFYNEEFCKKRIFENK